MSAPQPNEPRRDGSLPPGCKDLIDVIRSQPLPVSHPLPTITRRVTLPEKVAVSYLAELLGADMRTFTAEMRELGIGIGWYRSMSFDEAQRLLRRHGIWADKAA